MKTRIFVFTATLLSIGLLTAACGSHTTPTANSRSIPTSGGTLVAALSPGTNIDWYLPLNDAASDSNANIWLEDQIYKPLIHLNDAYQIVWKSSIASRITYNRAGTVYHVFLGRRWKWSDGQPVTARDLMFTWHVVQAVSSTTAPAPWPYVGEGTGDIPDGIKSVVENNQHEVTFTLDQPANQQWFIYNGLIQLTPLPAQVLDVDGDHWAQEAQYLGSIASKPSTAEKASDGPYVLDQATPNQRWVLTANPDYSGHKSHVHKLVFAYETSSSATFAAFRTRTVNWGSIDTSELSASQQLTRQGDHLFPGYTLGISWVALNMYSGTQDAPIFRKPYVRRALQDSIDQPALVKDIDKGYAVPTYGPIPSIPKTRFYDAAAEPPIAYNLQTAKALLARHGWHEIHGVMTRGHHTMDWTMIYVSQSASIQEEAEVLQADWKKIGIIVHLVPKNFNTYLTLTHDKTSNAWQLAVGSGWDYNGPGWYPTGGELFATGAPTGHGYSDHTEDQLIAATHQAYATRSQVTAAFDRYEAYTAAQVPMLWLPNRAAVYVTTENLKGGKTYSNTVTDDPAFNRMWMTK